MDIQLFIARKFSQRAVKKYQKQLALLKAKKAKHNIQSIQQALELYSNSEDVLDQLISMAFCIKETLGKDPFDTQLMCALALCDRKLAEMKTGEGKTLTVGLAAAVLAKKGPVHVVTSNEYLAKRDAQELAQAFNKLGITVGFNSSEMGTGEKQIAYLSQITYTTANELGFDYLRDNTAQDKAYQVQRGHESIIVDEADFLMIDEARTPLILSGQGSDLSEVIQKIWTIVKGISPSHFDIDKKARLASLNTEAFDILEREFLASGLIKSIEALYLPQNGYLLAISQSCANVRFCYRKDQDYVLIQGELKLIDEGTGRIMQGKRWGNFLHAAAEAKEGLKINPETQVQASITLQAYLRHYKHVCGLTGTCMTEAEEFEHTYGLECVAIPTRKPVIRKDLPDRVFVTQKAKLMAALSEIQAKRIINQPVLVGCETVEESMLFSDMLQKAKIDHNLLNGKDPEKEAMYISMAGLPGQITVTTQIAGRGTDIVLGGHEEDESFQENRQKVLQSGGLHVLFTCANASRRVDNQLRGRAGRQGDPGSSQRFVSLEDNLPTAFGANKAAALIQRMGVQEGDEISSTMISKAILNWQTSSERHGFQARKEIAKYDEAFTLQREAVYNLRQAILEDKLTNEYYGELVCEALISIILKSEYWNEYNPKWDLIEAEIRLKTGLELPLESWFEEVESSKFTQVLINKLQAGVDQTVNVLRYRHFTQVDSNWKEYLTHLESLKEGIHLQAYAQKNPVHVFKQLAKDSFESFREQLCFSLIEDLVRIPEIPTNSINDEPIERRSGNSEELGISS